MWLEKKEFAKNRREASSGPKVRAKKPTSSAESVAF
jgi:hypothetical protein